jgi:hypothetical protein
MMKINFERWLHGPQLAVGPPFPLRRAAPAGAACRRPARLAALVGAAFCASLAMTAAPADARPASPPAGADSTESGRPAADEFSSRLHGAQRNRHHQSSGFGKYGLQRDGGYSYGPKSYKASQRSGGNRDHATGGYGDRSFYKIQRQKASATQGRHKDSRGSPGIIGGYAADKRAKYAKSMKR